MKYVQCPRCRARFHTGFIYESVEECSRCGTPLPSGGHRIRDQLRALLQRRRDGLDWEAITKSQYVSHLGSRAGRTQPRGQTVG
jgi:hypothetical protein